MPKNVFRSLTQCFLRPQRIIQVDHAFAEFLLVVESHAGASRIHPDFNEREIFQLVKGNYVVDE